ncbi:MAG: GNAT family N-acetyltransferase, partial [Verrucomicrobiota bacterium]
MSAQPQLVFKFATEEWEFEEIHRLNYKTFVQEIPQHRASPAHRLVDKFHSENTYLICLCGRKLAGMLAVRGNRPFSLDLKLAGLD